MTAEPMSNSGPREGLCIAGLSKRFGDVVAVQNLSIEVASGALVGFLGPNGAGKTTTMRSVVGMVSPDHGTITWRGKPIDDATRTRIGYMPQDRGLYARMKVKDQIAYFGRLAGLSASVAEQRTSYWLDRLGLAERGNSVVQELSGGNQQRVQLAVALVHDPELLLLDEPFAGLDPVAAETMRTVISEYAASGASVLFSSHQLDLVEQLCEQVVIVSEGTLLAKGRVSELRSASPLRWMKVEWQTQIAQWESPEGTLLSFDGIRARVQLPATADVAACVAAAARAGSVAAVSIEPPGLDEIFVELVGASHRREEVAQ